MAKILGAVFGAPELPEATPVEEEQTKIDPNRDAELAAAARRKRSIFSRRGRGFLSGKGGQTRGGLSVGGSGTSVGGTKPKAFLQRAKSGDL